MDTKAVLKLIKRTTALAAKGLALVGGAGKVWVCYDITEPDRHLWLVFVHGVDRREVGMVWEVADADGVEMSPEEVVSLTRLMQDRASQLADKKTKDEVAA